MSIADRAFAGLRRGRARVEHRLNAQGRAHTLSLQRYQVYRQSLPLLQKHMRGVCLDVGSGHGPYAQPLAQITERVIRVDVAARSDGVDVIADLQDMPQVVDESVDSVLCAQVLEHVPRPADALSEIRRVLRPGGALLLTVPHLSVIHEAPNDFSRFTRYGLPAPAEGAGLEVEEIHEAGGFLSFVSHPVSYVLLAATAAIPGLRDVVWALNYLLGVRLLGALENSIGAVATTPCNYVMLARKP